ncbi:hypothetical protein ACLIN3_27270 (plasmid) [Pseudomonas orientalis]|uniref:hypothetical protein n=1 Tax=Pseudomonas orientalis TaxID=76758 RepID=UPI003987D201
MINKTCAIFMILFFFLSGCKEKGGDFVGHWADVKNPTTSFLDIDYSDGVYHIDVNSFDSYLTLKQKVVKLEGTAMSDSVLTIHAGLGNVDMRLEGDQIFFEHHVYKKTK